MMFKRGFKVLLIGVSLSLCLGASICQAKQDINIGLSHDSLTGEQLPKVMVNSVTDAQALCASMDIHRYTLSPAIDYGEFDALIDEAIYQAIISTDNKLFRNVAVMTNNNFERM